MAIRLVVADDHPLILDGLDALFRAEGDIEVMARCRDGQEALGAVRPHVDRAGVGRPCPRPAGPPRRGAAGDRFPAHPPGLDVVRFVLAGLRNKEIAERLGIGEGTVKIHLHNVYEKLGVDSRLALAAFAREKGLA